VHLPLVTVKKGNDLAAYQPTRPGDQHFFHC
jgi:hypothetical protein